MIHDNDCSTIDRSTCTTIVHVQLDLADYLLRDFAKLKVTLFREMKSENEKSIILNLVSGKHFFRKILFYK